MKKLELGNACVLVVMAVFGALCVANILIEGICLKGLELNSGGLYIMSNANGYVC
jgi:hypothetical protein